MKTVFIFAGVAAVLTAGCNKELPPVPPQVPKMTPAAPAGTTGGEDKPKAAESSK